MGVLNALNCRSTDSQGGHINNTFISSLNSVTGIVFDVTHIKNIKNTQYLQWKWVKSKEVLFKMFLSGMHMVRHASLKC